MTRRCFTLLETVLASVLASVVVLGCMAAFFALNRSDRVLSERFHEANDLARVQFTMQRAFTSLVLAPAGNEQDKALLQEMGIEPLTAQDAADGGQQAAGDGSGDGSGDQGSDASGATEETAETPPRPRILLEPDPDPLLTSMLQRSRFAAGGGGSSVATPQRLELVLSSVPIRPPSVQSTAWSNALVGVEDLPSKEELEAEGQEVYSGVRGAFVLRPDDPTTPEVRRREADGDTRIGWTLWWQPLDGRSEPARVASGLSACHYEMFFNREMLASHTAYGPEAMPTYIQLEVETLSGLYADYLFEVSWTVDTLAEDQAAADAAGQGDGAGGGNGGGGGRNGQGGPAAGGRGGGGQRDGADGRDPRARPRGRTPQSQQPGREVDGQPRRQGPPGGPGQLRPPPGGPGQGPPGRQPPPGGGGGGS